MVVKRVLGATLLMSSLAGCDDEQIDGLPIEAAEEPGEAEELPPLNDGERRINGKVLAEVVLDGGTELTFVESEAEGASVVFLLESVPPGAIGLADIAETRGTNVLDVFWAVTEPGTEVPAEFERAVPGGFPRGDQGWLLDLMPTLDIVKPRYTCLTNTAFQSALNSFGYTDRIWTLYDEEPSASPYFEYYSDAPNGSYYRYDVTALLGGQQFQDVDRWYSLVQACALGYHPSIMWSGLSYPHYGPYVQMKWRATTTWTTVVYEDVQVADIGRQYAWHAYTANDYDYGTWIDISAQNDIWDIGARGEDI